MTNKNLLIGVVIAVGIIALLGSKVGSSPSSSSSSGSGSGVQVSLTTDPTPLRMGNGTFIIEVKDTTGKPVDNATVSFDLNMTSMNMGTQQGNATAQGDGRYAAAGKLTMKGPWRVRTKVTMSDGRVENKDFTVNVP